MARSDKEKKTATETYAAWTVALLALVGFYALLRWTSGPSHSKWAPIYLAGAAGGFCFELMRNKWRIEFPSDKQSVGKHFESSFAPFGPLGDLGFLGRMITGAVAAPTFLGIVNALNAPTGQSVTKYLTGVAGRSETIAWGVAVGFAAPAVWSMIEGFVKARGAAADMKLEIADSNAARIEQKADELIAASNGTSPQVVADIKALAHASRQPSNGGG